MAQLMSARVKFLLSKSRVSVLKYFTGSHICCMKSPQQVWVWLGRAQPGTAPSCPGARGQHSITGNRGMVPKSFPSLVLSTSVDLPVRPHNLEQGWEERKYHWKKLPGPPASRERLTGTSIADASLEVKPQRQVPDRLEGGGSVSGEPALPLPAASSKAH